MKTIESTVQDVAATSQSNGQKLDIIMGYVSGAEKVGTLTVRWGRKISGPLIAALLTAGILTPEIANIFRALLGLTPIQ